MSTNPAAGTGIELQPTVAQTEHKSSQLSIPKDYEHVFGTSTSLQGVLLKGKQGDVQEVLGDEFVDNKRSFLTSCLRGIGATLCAMTGVGCVYVASRHYLVPDGFIGVSINNGVPQVVGPGHHVLLSPLNSDFRVVKITKSHIHVESFDIITVKAQQYGLAFVQGQPLILEPGVHVMNDPYFQFDKFVDQKEAVISHGTVHRIIVKQGHRALAWNGNKPVLFKAGIYEFVNPLFRFVKSVPIDQEVMNLEPFTIITVDDGRVGISYDRGVLRIMMPGEHWLNAEVNQKFLDFLPTTQQVRELKTLDVLTTDGVMVRIRGSITFRIADPELAVLHIGSESNEFMGDKRRTHITEAIFSTIMRRANDTLASLLTGTEVLNSAGLGFASSSVMMDQDSMPGGTASTPANTYPTEKKKRDHNHIGDARDNNAELNTMIRQRFKDSLTATLRSEWGVELRDMNVIDIEVLDQKVREALAQGVRCNIVAVTDRRTAESKAETARILAQGDRDAAKIHTDGQTYSVEEMAKAQQKAGQLLEQTPVAVEIRLAETAAGAFSNSKAAMVIAPDASSQTIMQLIGAGSRLARFKGNTGDEEKEPLIKR